MAYIEFNNVVKTYGAGESQINALDGANFTVERGELAVILGASGAGKTTALNILGGMDTATSGTVMVDGRNITHATERELVEYRRTDVGFVFQFYNLVPNLTALENVELAAQVCANALDAEESLCKVGLAKRLGNFPASFRAASSSASPSLALSPRLPSSCSATSPRAPSTTKQASRSCSSSKIPVGATASPSSSSRTTLPSPPWPTASFASRAAA